MQNVSAIAPPSTNQMTKTLGIINKSAIDHVGFGAKSEVDFFFAILLHSLDTDTVHLIILQKYMFT